MGFFPSQRISLSMPFLESSPAISSRAVKVPCSRILLSHISPVMLAGLLYMGAGLGIGGTYLFRIRCEPATERLRKKI